MVALSAHWPFPRTADRLAPRPDRLLRDNPALLLSALQAPETVAGLVAQWNPGSAAAADGEGAASITTALTAAIPVEVAEGIRWHGPIRLTPMLRADAGFPAAGLATSLGLAYVAEVHRERVKIGDSRYADRLRRRYPHGLPAGGEAEAWHLVRGLAKRLRGVARLPGGPVHSPHEDPPLPGDTDHAVYGHEMLPWMVLREILRPIAPDLAREVVPDGGGYILRHRELVEVRVRPTGPGTRLPYALRDRADDAWPHSVYEFCDLSTPASGGLSGPTGPTGATGSTGATGPPCGTGAAHAVRTAAALIAEVTGGVLFDADGFPRAAQTFAIG